MPTVPAIPASDRLRPTAETLMYTTIDSPIGELLLLGDSLSLHGLHIQEGDKPIAISPSWKRSPAPFTGVCEQLAEYFAGQRRAFDLTLTIAGPPFHRRVWSALREIPYGETASYGQVARHIGRPTAARAVGMANNRNPIAVIVPCHRVIGADGMLTGYAGGIERKRMLLDLEERARASRVAGACSV